MLNFVQAKKLFQCQNTIFYSFHSFGQMTQFASGKWHSLLRANETIPSGKEQNFLMASGTNRFGQTRDHQCLYLIRNYICPGGEESTGPCPVAPSDRNILYENRVLGLARYTWFFLEHDSFSIIHFLLTLVWIQVNCSIISRTSYWLLTYRPFRSEYTLWEQSPRTCQVWMMRFWAW